MRNQNFYDCVLGLGGFGFWTFALGFGSIPQQHVRGQRKTYEVVKDHQCSIEIQKACRGFDGLVVLHIEQRTGGSVTQGPTLKDLRGLEHKD